MLSQCELTERASATQTCPLPIFLSPHSNTHSYTQSDLGFRLGFPGVSDGKDSACNVGDLGLIPGLGRSLEEGMATHSSTLAWRIPMDRGAWWAEVHGVAKSRAGLSD